MTGTIGESAPCPQEGSLTAFSGVSYTDTVMSETLIQVGRRKQSASTSGPARKTMVGFVNLGCTKNQVDSEIMLGTLAAGGFELTGNPKKAEVVIINTCGFIDNAKQESIDTILQYVDAKEQGLVDKVYVTGCLSQRYKDDLEKEIPQRQETLTPVR